MRISDLSSSTGISIATIKFYLREGLLQPGVRTGRNQARYTAEHRRRLILIRTLTAVAQLDLNSVRILLAAVDDRAFPLSELHDAVHRVLFPVDRPPVQSENLAGAGSDIDQFVKELGWQVRPDAPGRVWLALVLAALRDLGCDCPMEFFEPYMDAAKRIATQELDLVPAYEPRDAAPVMVRSILLGVAFSAMRMLAEEHVIAQRAAEL